MDFSEHLLISGAGSAAILAGGGGAESAAAFLVTGVFIDVDHLADYWRETGINTDVRRFWGYFVAREPKHLWLFLHAWEWCFLSFLVLSFSGLGAQASWTWWAAWGWLLHLVLDHLFNGMHPHSYFFSFRARHRFHAHRFYPPD